MLKNIKSLAPLLDRVLVQRMKAETKTSSGIFLPDSAVKELNEGKVLAVGPGLHDKDGKRIPLGVQAGDKVLIPQFGGSPIKVGEEEFTLFRDHEYVARIPMPSRYYSRGFRDTNDDCATGSWPRSTSKYGGKRICTIPEHAMPYHHYIPRTVREELAWGGVPQKEALAL
jgi:chaperonin GroES